MRNVTKYDDVRKINKLEWKNVQCPDPGHGATSMSHFDVYNSKGSLAMSVLISDSPRFGYWMCITTPDGHEVNFEAFDEAVLISIVKSFKTVSRV